MKNFILGIVIIFCASDIMAQVYVGDGFIYSKGTDLYAKGNINLSTNGKIYLRGEAQLIQGDDIPNEGPGELSVFQEGNANNYTYNYWSAPVGQALTTSGNEGFVNTQIHFPRLQANFIDTGFQTGAAAADLRTNFVIDSQQATILPVGVRDGLTDDQDATALSVVQPLRIAGRWLYTYNNGGGAYSGWAAANSAAANVAPGYGFSMKGVNGAGPNIVSDAFTGAFGQRYDFRGRPNNGNISVNVNTDDFSLVGNPYPSALDLKQFLIDNNYSRPSVVGAGNEMINAVIDNQILFWEQNSTSHQLTDYEGGYGIYVPDAVAESDLDANGQYIGSNNGMYTPPVYTRFDSNGNITVQVNPGLPAPVGISDLRRYAPIGQGFMISRTENSATATAGEAVFTALSNGVATFSNNQRVFYREDGGLSFFKAAPGSTSSSPTNGNPIFVRPKLKLNIKINDLYVRQLLLAFGDDSTDNLDWGLEGKIDANKQATDVYMPQFGGEYVIKTIPFAVSKTVDLGLEVAANNTTFEFHVGSFENFDTPNVYIHDKYTNTIHDVKNGSYIATIDAGTVEDRFEIVFQDPTTLSNDTVNVEGAFDIVQNNNRQLLTVFNPNGLEVSNIALFDLAGKEVISSKEGSTNNAFTFETGNLSAGIYIVRVSTADQQETAVKVSVSN